MTDKLLSGRIAVVTGAASGIGAATAERLAADGASVALVSRRTDRLEKLATAISEAGGTALAVQLDVTDPDSVARAAGTISERLGRVDLLVNAAGVLLETPVQAVDEWVRTIDTNLTGVLRVIAAFTPDLTATASAGGRADIVNVSSVMAHQEYPGYAAYSASKAALTQLSASLRADLSPQDVRVTNIEPGIVHSELRTHVSAQEQETLAGVVEQVGALEAADIADLIVYAVSRRREVNLSHLVALPLTQV
jgi:NADP-dependent 3-hydroxy acid dehydrogenase YdfG